MYKINIGFRVNTKTSKTGVKWEYRGKRSEYKSYIDDWRDSIKAGCYLGVKVTDLDSGEIVFFETKENIK